MSRSQYLLKTTIAHIIGANGTTPLGGTRAGPLNASANATQIAAFLREISGDPCDHVSGPLLDELRMEYAAVEKIFCDYYEARPELVNERITGMETAESDEQRAEAVTRVWLPELQMSDADILARWHLRNVKPIDPVRPDQVTLQLNGLYTLPDEIPEDLEPGLLEAWKELGGNPGRKVADYDHPVPLFVRDEWHELVNCLDELETDLDFEKEQGVLPGDHRMLVTLSVSVTHERLDALCGMWIKALLRNKVYRNLRVLVLTEEAVKRIKRELLSADHPVYSVFGKYAKHFNALKYTQLLLERAYGILAGFKLDTDEGIRSHDAHAVTGKTWLQILCHGCWGAAATDWKGRAVTLAVNEGEYINSADLDRLGYRESARCPDVAAPDSYIGPEIFFNKAFAHGRATALYNQFNRLEDHISHPVVKGGGYGITNIGLRGATPFAFSQVGRAEDQQFYFSGLARGIRGIFHPDLRIAHYKHAVARSEHRTQAARFIGDMYRLILFGELASAYGVKEDLDPMPGVFAGEMARCQAFFNLLYRAYVFAADGDTENCDILINEGKAELKGLQREIDSGEVARKLQEEQDQWQDYVRDVDGLRDAAKVRAVTDSMII